jgi:NTE family protein
LVWMLPAHTLGSEMMRENPAVSPFERAEVSRPGVGIALGGGFARGLAHLGVLQVLEQNQIPISCIAGTSVGAILGAAYASGTPLARIIDTCRTLKFRDIARWQVSRLGLTSNDRLGHLMQRLLAHKDFDGLQIPLAVVATDLNTGEPVVLTHGNLIDSVRASCAFPGLMQPVKIGTRSLADGGLVAPVPTRAVRDLGAQFVLGVSVGIQNWDRGTPGNVFQVIARAVSAAQKHQLETWEEYADLVVRPDVDSMAWDDFDRAEEAIAAGAKMAWCAIPRIQRYLDSQEAERDDAKAESLLTPGIGIHLVEAIR